MAVASRLPLLSHLPSFFPFLLPSFPPSFLPSLAVNSCGIRRVAFAAEPIAGHIQPRGPCERAERYVRREHHARSTSAVRLPIPSVPFHSVHLMHPRSSPECSCPSGRALRKKHPTGTALPIPATALPGRYRQQHGALSDHCDCRSQLRAVPECDGLAAGVRRRHTAWLPSPARP